MDYKPFYFSKVYNRRDGKSDGKKRKFSYTDGAYDYPDYVTPTEDNGLLPRASISCDDANGNGRASLPCRANETEELFEAHIPSDERTLSATSDAPHRKRRISSAAVLIIIILLCFAITAVSAELLSDGAVTETLKSTFNENYLATYYLVTTVSNAEKTQTEAQAVLIRESGGAGYVMQNGDKYYVVIATYLNKSDAKSVAKKNENFEINEIYTVKTTLTADDTSGISSDTDRYLTKLTEKLITLTFNLDSAAVGTTSAMELIRTYRDEALLKKEEITSSALNSTDKSSVLLRLNAAFGSLDALVSANVDDNLCGSLRYITSVIIGAML